MSPTVALTRDHVRRIDHYEVYAAAGTTYWVDTTHYRVTAGATQRLLVIGGIVNRDANGTCIATLYNVDNEPIHQYCSLAAATGVYSWAVSGGGIFIMDPGDYIELLFGAAQGVGAYASCVVMELQP